MPCEILTEGVLKAALRRQLPAGHRAALLRHLREPCEACLDLLEGLTAEDMLLPTEDVLSREEQQTILPAALPAQLSPIRPDLRLAHLARRRSPRLAWVGAAAALVLVGLLAIPRPMHRAAPTGLKGDSVPTVRLIPLAGARTPTPHVVRALVSGGRLAAGELLLLRIHLAAPAWVYLLSQKGEAAELIWPLQQTARHEAGEFEVAQSGAALAIDPAVVGSGGRLLLIASLEPIDRRQLEVRTPALTREDLGRTFAGCGVDLFPILIEPR